VQSPARKDTMHATFMCFVKKKKKERPHTCAPALAYATLIAANLATLASLLIVWSSFKIPLQCGSIA
jgi:hypothetical protein